VAGNTATKPPEPEIARRLPFGAEPLGDGLASFRVWAPDHGAVDVVLAAGEQALAPEGDGCFSGVAPCAVGGRYGYRLAGHDRPLPDPASRWQPDGPHGLSALVDPDAFTWRDRHWTGPAPDGHVFYEMHVGTFTPEGTWTAAHAHLPRLRDLGVTVVQMMPVAEFGGAFGWGYDGVCWFAPSHLYGSPDDLRAFVDDAHGLGLAVVLDVVYNHFGPEGNYLCTFARSATSDCYTNEWGDALNFDQPGSAGMRLFATSNAEYWVREYHFDGLRLDATQQIFDHSPEHVVSAIVRHARAAAGSRRVIVLGENEPQESALLRPPEQGGFGLDLLYNDDFHHSARVALTGVREAYYTDYRGDAQELVSALRWGFLFQGQRYSWQGKARGQPALDLSPDRFLAFLENHDQVANAARGERLSTLAAPGALRALTALLLLSPATPMLFQGQEIGADRPFRFFADHDPSLAALVRDGRREFLSQFVRYAQEEVAATIDPANRDDFEAAKLDHRDTPRARAWWALHRDLLALRRRDLRLRRAHPQRPEGAVLRHDALALRWVTPTGDDRLLLANLGPDVEISALAEPLLAPPALRPWRLAFSSDALEYGGGGAVPYDAARWLLPGRTTTFLTAAGEAVDRDEAAE
jgi:maltooligosyltrehalose trehalohydrolase